MPWITSPPRSRARRLWGRLKRWEYDHTVELRHAGIALFVVGCMLALVLLARVVSP